MSSTISVSKGVFIFKNGAKAASKKSRKKGKTTDRLYCDSLWYRTYRSFWKSLEKEIQDLNREMYSTMLGSLVDYIRDSYKEVVSEIPAAALLTGINMPDHSAQFKTLNREIREYVSPHVAILKSEDCQNLKYLVENMCNQFVSLDEDSGEEELHIKKSQCNFSFLQSWYEDLYLTVAQSGSPKKQKRKNNRKPLVVIIPDFEGLNPRILQDFILIASSYINILPFVFVFGVATSLAVVHQSLPYHVTSKIKIEVFRTSPAIVYLNNVLENILFNDNFPFHLGSKVFNLFTDIFLFYDLSVSGFIQNFKYAMLEHFSYGNAMALCNKNKTVSEILADFDKDDFENVRRLLSFRKLVENEPSPEKRIKLLTDDEYFKTVLKIEIKKIHKYIRNFHLFLKCLQVLVGDLPNVPLGKQVRELYSIAVAKDVTKTQEYKECFQLLSFQSKDELSVKISKIADLLSNNCQEKFEINDIIEQLNSFSYQMNNLGAIEGECSKEKQEENLIEGQMDRKQLREKLLSMSKQKKPMNKYEKLRTQILNFLTAQFQKFLIEPTNFYFHEIFFFNNISIQNHIIGSHRAAVHTALNDPHSYLQCSCCEISNDSIILKSMPDICIVYKLHLECGKMINLYDWLQSFLSIIDPQNIDHKVDQQLQARFTQAVTELEYLGFIKSSKRKTDHVTRLTWGG